MAIKLQTKELQSVTQQLGKVQINRLLEITKYWHIYGSEGFITFTAYDGADFVRISFEHEGELDVIVNSEQFSKLIDKTTVSHVTLEQLEGSLKVVGNGEYFLEIVTEDEEYPTFDEFLPEDIDTMPYLELKSQIFSDIADINSSSVSKSQADGIYTGYLIDGNKSISTDIIKVCIHETYNFDNKFLISSSAMNILSTIKDEDIFVWFIESEVANFLYITSASSEIFIRLMEGVEDYVDVAEIDEQSFDHSVTLPTVDIQSVISRLSLFMSVFDKGTINLTFTKKHLALSTSTGSKEIVKYSSDVKNVAEFSCVLNSTLLSDILSTVTDASLKLSYGNDTAVKIESSNAHYFVALQEGDGE